MRLELRRHLIESTTPEAVLEVAQNLWCRIPLFGGRRWWVEGFVGEVALNEVVKAAHRVAEVAGTRGKEGVFASIVEQVTQKDREGEALLMRQGWLTRLLTRLRQLNNLLYQRALVIQGLVMRCLASRQQSWDDQN